MADDEKGNEDGILLYYKYAKVPDVRDLVRFYDSNCTSLGLLGRVRIAPDGVNVTVGGKMSSLKKHIEDVKSIGLFEGTDFKLASCGAPSDDRVVKESGFTSLSVRVVKELVTLHSHPVSKSPDISNAGKHLSAVEFHSVLQSASKCEDKKIVLLDARNVYETRIGKFRNPHVETLDPEIRQYSDLPAWIDEHSDQLHGSQVLMYCTGGIRCEMASAYIRSKGSGFENVYQLFGGIQRYLEEFPDGGFFKGKNFVFDHRIAVGSHDPSIVGSCLICGSSFDDYSLRCRCIHCRMLVLVCNRCQDSSDSVYVCELCKKHSKGGGGLTTENSTFDSERTLDTMPDLLTLSIKHELDIPLDNEPSSEHTGRADSEYSRKLRILCLHGFRQNASNFKGRTSSLAKKLKSIAELVFVDAPHVLPFVYQPREMEPHRSPRAAPSQQANKKFAWLVSPDSSFSMGSEWKIAGGPFDPLQYQQQTEGFEKSYAYLKSVFSKKGPFDGVLGFSQGAAMAALLCACRGNEGRVMDFRFAVLCSGFPVIIEEFGQGLIDCPSLHIFGNNRGNDRQIARNVSEQLACMFDKSCSVVVEHESGHIIPTWSPYIDQIRSFLSRFL
ncbi:Rhodanese-like domain-containing protein 6 [Acorus calamus]|uniref:Rhodanese-like domain-containing protein 6 n=1 Tax=Acorus calamus TaxID=4465 RepID=A0AAV9EXM3_ACOCL|nr:Rhodanese-like domain-containing protein 6 [Acorus calamus]